MGKPLLSCKWALMILLKLAEKPRRPSELKREIKGVTEKILYTRLKVMTQLGLIKKCSNNKYPLEVYYKLVNEKFLKELVRCIRNLPLCIEKFVSIISKKWILEIMNMLVSERAPKEILSNISGLSEKVLYQRLNELEMLDLVKRIVYNSKPVMIKYKLTAEGRSALPVLRRSHELILSS
jgi:DNA-binding HxlR family transcriptional regulator